MKEFMDKKEVALWLRRYAFFSGYIQQKENYNKPIKEVFEKFAKKNGIVPPYHEAYVKMVKINLLYSNLTVFSYLYDNSNNYWLAAEVENAIQEKPDEYGRLNRIFLGKSGSKKFDKRVIVDIRNALNHCENKELFRISKDGETIEINAKNGTFQVKLDLGDLTALIKIAMENMRNFPLVTIENEEQLDYSTYSKLRRTLYGSLRYCRTFNKKKYEMRFEELMKKTTANPEDVNEFLEILKNFKRDDLKNKSKSLSRGQLDFITESIAYQDESGRRFYNPDYAKAILTQLVYLTLPIGAEKITTINTLNEIYNRDNWEKSYLDIMKSVMTNDSDIGDYKKIVIANGSFWINFSAMLYYRYLATHVKCDEEVRLGNGKMFFGRIRNALTHGRWGLGKGESIYLYDTGNDEKYFDDNLGVEHYTNLSDLKNTLESVWGRNQCYDDEYFVP